MVQNYRAAVKILDIDIAHGAVFDPVRREKARLWWYHHGIRAGDDIGIRDAFTEIAIAITCSRMSLPTICWAPAGPKYASMIDCMTLSARRLVTSGERIPPWVVP